MKLITRQTNTLINLDYTNPIDEKTKLEIGLEARLQGIENNFVTTNPGVNELDKINYDYNRDIYSAYINVNRKFGKLNAQIGLRAETVNVQSVTDTIGKANLKGTDNYKNDYIQVYPSAFLTYNPSENNQYQISFSRRVDRPSMYQVSPIRAWSTPLLDRVGNPELNPQFTNSIEFNYTRQLGKGSLTSGVFYRIIEDQIYRSFSISPYDNQKQLFSFQNYENNYSFGIELSGNYKITDWWDVNSSFDLYKQTLRGLVNDQNEEIDDVSWNSRVNNNFRATKNLRFQLSGLYRGANKSLQYDISPRWKIDAGVRYNFLQGKASLQARINDIFNTFFFAYDQINPFIQSGEAHWESRTVYLGFSYKLGGGNTKERKRKDRSDNEIQEGGGGL